MKTIAVKLLPATNTKPARIQATAQSRLRWYTPRQETLDYNLEEGYEENCVRVAKALCVKLHWDAKVHQQEWQGGHTKEGMVFCLIGAFPSFKA